MNPTQCRHLFVLMIFVLFAGCAAKDEVPPEVTSTIPQNGSQDVDPSLREIRITFSEPMQDKSWSWCLENKHSFPETTGNPHYSDNCTTNILPVRLEPNTEYVLWINKETYTNFKDKAGLPAKPYRLSFKTR